MNRQDYLIKLISKSFDVFEVEKLDSCIILKPKEFYNGHFFILWEEDSRISYDSKDIYILDYISAWYVMEYHDYSSNMEKLEEDIHKIEDIIQNRTRRDNLFACKRKTSLINVLGLVDIIYESDIMSPYLMKEMILRLKKLGLKIHDSLDETSIHFYICQEVE